MRMEMEATREDRDTTSGMFLTACDLMRIEDPGSAMAWDTDPNVIRREMQGDLTACREPMARAEERGVRAAFEQENYRERNSLPDVTDPRAPMFNDPNDRGRDGEPECKRPYEGLLP